jgi:hypothetical protein
MNALLRLWRVTKNERAQGKILKSFCSGMQNTFGRSLFFYSDGEHLAARMWGGHIDNIGHPPPPRRATAIQHHRATQ